ncbi:phosphocholine cytidylyltransferase family protein [Candidatus Pacearchaeota archaeon]|nr:phosphocholine cytidylyltransferase family protein [Candidatus Pacearchaeota archaeon]
MKAIICAAGMGTRLGKYTENLPKCMLEFNNKPLLEHQVDTLRSSGINDISIVRGYMPDKINITGTKYYENPDFATTNMVASLMTAEKEMSTDSEILICYADILYEKRLIDKIQKSKSPVSVLVDDDWAPYWMARLDDWRSDIESLTYDSESKIIDIGNPHCKLEDAMSRYIGLIKFNNQGIQAFKEIFHENKKKHWNSSEPWLRSKSFKQAYMTCMLQEMVNKGIDVHAVHTKKGWLEFDTSEDIEKAIQWNKTGEIKKYINLK